MCMRRANFNRNTDAWQNRKFGADDALAIPSLEFTLPVSELYLGVDQVAG